MKFWWIIGRTVLLSLFILFLTISIVAIGGFIQDKGGIDPMGIFPFFLMVAMLFVLKIALFSFEKKHSIKYDLADAEQFSKFELSLIIAITVIILISFNESLNGFARHDSSMAITLFAVLLGVVIFIPMLKKRKVIIRLSEEEKKIKHDLEMKESESKIQNINHRYDVKTGSISFQTEYINKEKWLKGKPWRWCPDIDAELEFKISRPISAMSHKEREACRVLELLEVAGLHSYWSQNLRATIVWADGKGVVDTHSSWRIYRVSNNQSTKLADGINNAVDWFIKTVVEFDKFDSAVSGLLKLVEELSGQLPEHPAIMEIKSRLEGGNAWLRTNQLTKFGFTTKQPDNGGIFLGNMKDNHECWIANEGAIITIAPPGSGKTQTHIIPNLLTWRGSAVVLDVKGDLWDKTAGYRAKYVGSVYRFNPLEPENSHCYNPLTIIRSDLDYVWEDALFLATIIVPRSKTKTPFWEKMARSLIGAAIAVECINNDPENRKMSTIVDYCYAGDNWTDFLTYLSDSKLKELRRIGGDLISATHDTKQTLGNIRQEAQSAISSWAGRRIERATGTSDWHPNDLRDKPVTIYISLKAGEIDTYADLLRVFIAQHIRTLIQKLPDESSPDILFMLDEFPRLKYMPELEEALEIGRQFKIKLFLAIQTVGQLKQHYANAEGIISACKVKAFMNPSSLDETAQKIIKELGFIDSIVDGTRRNIADITELSGEEYANDVIILTSGCKPIRAKKAFAYKDEELNRRMSMPPPDIAYDKELKALID